MPNPYTLLPVDASEYFVAARGGRGAQAENILQHILRLNPPPEPVSLLGERRFGKSSLLRYLEQATLDTPDLLTASIDLLSLSPQTPEGFYAVLRESLIWAEALPDESPALTYISFRKYLFELRRERRRLVVLIDEFDLVTRDRHFEKAFFDNLRSLVTHFPLTLVVASVAPLSEMAHQDVFTSPFWNVFVKRRLRPLSRAEAEALVSQGGSPDGLGEAVNEIVELAGLHPFFLQTACSLAWELRAEAGGLLDMDTLRSEFTAQVGDHYQYIWDQSNSVEQTALCALAKGTQADGAGLAALAARGYVDTRDPKLTFGAGFADFVQNQRVEAQSRDQPEPDPIQVGNGVREQQLALVVGVNTYLHQQAGDYFLAPLQYAERDAKEIETLLNKIGFQEVRLLLGEQATYDAVEGAFAELSQATAGGSHPESRFVFHFSGHGMIDPYDNETAYLMLYDSDPRDPAATGLEMAHLVYNFLPKVRVPNALVLLDSCHAGFAAGVRHVRPDESSRLLNVTTQVFGRVHGRMVLAACPGAAKAREIDELRHGIFTHYLLRHWRDLEEPHPPDRITVGSLVDYVGYMIPRDHPRLPLPAHRISEAGTGGSLILFHIPPMPTSNSSEGNSSDDVRTIQ